MVEWGKLRTGGNTAAAAAAAAKLLQLCPTLRDPIDRSPPGSATPGILQAIKEILHRTRVDKWTLSCHQYGFQAHQKRPAWK